MATLTPQELLTLWIREEELTPEMAIGHILQNLVEMQHTLEAMTVTLYNLRSDLDSLIAFTGMKPEPQGKRPSASGPRDEVDEG